MRRIFAVALLVVLGSLLSHVNSQDIQATPAATQEPLPEALTPSDLTPSSGDVTEAPTEAPTLNNETPTALATVDVPAPTADTTLEAQPSITPLATDEAALPITPTESVILLPTATPIFWPLFVRELFDADPGVPWVIPAGWARDAQGRLSIPPLTKVSEGASVQALPPVHYATALDHVQTQAAFFLSTGSTAAVSVRVSDAGAYTAQLELAADVSVVRLLRGSETVSSVTLPLPIQDSHTLNLMADGPTITVRVDDQFALFYVDAEPLPAGSLEWGGLVPVDAAFALDDIFIWQPALVPAAPVSPTALIEASPTAAPVLTEETSPTPDASATPLTVGSAAPASPDDEVSAQITLPLDTPTSYTPSSVTEEMTWTYTLPTVNGSYYLEIVRNSGNVPLDLDTSDQFGNKRATASVNGHVIVWMSQATSGTKSFDTVPRQIVNPQASTYTITVRTTPPIPVIDMNDYVRAGYVFSAKVRWAYEITNPSEHYLDWYRGEDFPGGNNLSYQYTIRRRIGSTPNVSDPIVSQGYVNPEDDLDQTAMYVSSTTVGWYDVEFDLQRDSSSAWTQGAYELGLLEGNPFPLQPTGFALSGMTENGPTFTFDSVIDNKTQSFFLLRKPGPNPNISDFQSVSSAESDATEISDSNGGLQCGVEYTYKLLAYNWAAPSLDLMTLPANHPTENNLMSSPVNLTLPCPLSNDARYSPQAVTSFPQNFTYTNIATATNAQGDPFLSCTSSDATGYSASVWYRLSLPTTQTIEINTFGSDYDTVLAVYRTANDSLATPMTEIACHDDFDSSGGDRTSQLVFTAEARTIYYVMVVKWGASLPSPNNVAHIHIGTLKTPSAPVLLLPINNGSTAGELSWNPVVNPNTTPASNIYTYHIQVAAASTFTNRLIDSYIGGGESYNFAFDNLADGKYYWRVRAITPEGLASAWSTARLFYKDTVPPLAPTITAPALNGVIATLRPTFTASAVGATRYNWQVSKNAAFTQLVTLEPTQNTTPSLVLTHSLPQGQYYVRAQACDAAMNCGPNTTIERPFQIDLRTLPAANASVIVTAPTTALTFKWAVPQGVSDFTLEVSDDSTFASTDFTHDFVITPGVTTPTTWTIPNVGTSLGNGTFYWRLVLTIPATNAGDPPVIDTTSVPRRFVVTPPVAPAPRLDAQPNAGILNTNTPTLSWQAVSYSYIVVYEVQMDNQSTFISPEYTEDNIANTTQITDTLTDGTYYVRVRAVNEFGAPGLWSAAQRIIVDTQAPAVPTITTPYLNAPSSNARQPAIWKAVPGANLYHVQYSTTENFNTGDLVAEKNNIPVTTATLYGYNPTVSFTPGTYFVRVKARDAALNWSSFTAPVSYTFLPNTSPINNATVVKPAATGARPLFQWAGVPGATQYQVIVSTQSDCSSDLLHISPVLGATARSYTYPPTSPSAAELTFGIYYWCVAVNRGPSAGGPNTLEMPPTGFRLNVSPSVPPAVAISAPLTTQPLSNAQVTISWGQASALVMGQPLSYEVQVDDSALFNTLDFTTITDLTGGYPQTTTLPDGKYNVRVRTLNSVGGVGPWSTVRTFTIDTQAPDVPDMLTPAQDSSVTALLPALTWTAETGATSYNVRISSQADLDPYYEWTVSTTTTAAPFALLKQTYYVQVRSVDGAGNRSAFSPTRVFTVQWATTQPPIPMRATIEAPALSWEAVTWATRYRVEVSRNATFTLLVASSEQAGTTFTVPPLVDGVYYWRVRAGTSTLWYAWSDVVTFAVDAP